MAERIVMPSFGMYTAEGQLVGWLEPDGTPVRAGQPVLEIETQKSTESVIAPAAGILRHVAPRGAQVKEEALLGYIVAQGEAIPSAVAPSQPSLAPVSNTSALPKTDREVRAQPSSSQTRLKASPIARRLTKEHGLDLRQLSGSGPGGRIVEADVKAALRGPKDAKLAGVARTGGIASNGLVQRGLTIQSQVLGRSVRYAVYLPPNYETSQRRYPVIYLLHGYTDNEVGWLQFGEADQVADAGIARRTIPPMILVMPDGGGSFYINNYDGSVRYEDFFIQEFIPFIESRFRVRSEPSSRAVAGVSMGGFGSLAYALRYPGLFTACAAFSSALLTDDEFMMESDARWSRVYAGIYGPSLKGPGRITDHLRSYSPIDIVRNSRPEQFKDVRLYLDCGDDDLFSKGNSSFHILLRDRNIPHEDRIRQGGHTWSYWRTGLLEAMRFLGASFYW
jgi:enterochelin esterase-like enzyme